MQSAPELYMDQGAMVSYNFFHLTLQEYLAAVHISLEPMEEQLQYYIQAIQQQQKKEQPWHFGSSLMTPSKPQVQHNPLTQVKSRMTRVPTPMQASRMVPLEMKHYTRMPLVLTLDQNHPNPPLLPYCQVSCPSHSTYHNPPPYQWQNLIWDQKCQHYQNHKLNGNKYLNHSNCHNYKECQFPHHHL